MSGSEEKEKRDPDKQSEEKEKEDDDDDEKNPERAKGTRIDKEKGGSDEQCMGCIIRWEPPPPCRILQFLFLGRQGGRSGVSPCWF